MGSRVLKFAARRRGAHQLRELRTGPRPKPPTLKEPQKQKLPIDLVIDGLK